MLTASSVIVALVAVAPGIAAWWTGRRVARFTDDPALPELLFARQQRLTLIVATALAITLVFGGSGALWGIPLMGLALLVGRYPLSRSLQFESSTLPRYLWRSVKSIVAGFGFWIILAWTPELILGVSARGRVVVGMGLLMGLLVWERWYMRLWLWLHEATPLVDDALAPRIAAIVERAGIAPPGLYRIGGPDARYANALALPSLHGPAIGLGNRLLELLEPDEAAAIYAHELAHIEQFSPRRMRRLEALNRALIVLAVALPLVAQWLAPESAYWVPLLWPLVVVASLVMRARKRQQDETESDLRAAALVGDPDAVARGLIKVYVHAFIPRRWPVNFERSASHPSLARRIQALRGGGAQAAGAIGEPIVLPTARPGTVVVFDDTRAWWFDGVPPDSPHTLDALRAQASSMRSVVWSELIELRVTASGDGRALRAAHRRGESWSVPLDPAQVAAIQKALDRIDVRLHRDLGRPPFAGVRLVATLALLAALVAGEVGVVLVPAVLALIRPGTAAIAALGAMALGRAVFGLLLGDASWFADRPELGAAALALVGVLALSTAWRRVRTQARDEGARLVLLALTATTLLVLIPLVMAAPDLPRDQLARLPLLPTLAVSLLGLAAALIAAGKRAGQRSGIAAATAALATGAVVLSASDIRGTGEPLARTTARAEVLQRVEFDTPVSGLQLSPGGARYVVQRPDEVPMREAPGQYALRYVVGDFADSRDIDAMQIAFLDDDRVLVLRAVEQGAELHLERADSDLVIWTTTLPTLLAPRLAVSPRDGTWSVVGEEARSDSLYVLTGTATPGGVVRRFAPLDSVSGMDQLVFDGGARVIIPALLLRGRVSTSLAMLQMASPRVALWEMTRDGLRLASEMNGYPQCGAPDRRQAICFVRERSRGRIWTIQANGEARPFSRVPGSELAQVSVGPGATLTVARRDMVTAVDVEARRMVDISLPPEAGYLQDTRVAAGRLVVLRQADGTSHLVLYRVTP